MVKNGQTLWPFFSIIYEKVKGGTMIMVCSSHATASDFLSKKGLRKTHFWFHCYMWYSCGTALFFNTLILSVRSIIYEPLRTLALKYLSQEQRKAKFHVNRCPTIVVKSSMICWKKLNSKHKKCSVEIFHNHRSSHRKMYENN